MEADRLALASLVRGERGRRRLTIEQAAAKAGMSPVTWGNVELGRAVRPTTYAVIEEIFDWPRGSIDLYMRERVEPPQAKTVEEPSLPEYIMKLLDDENLPEEDRFQIVRILQEEYARDEEELQQRQRDRLRLVAETWRRARS